MDILSGEEASSLRQFFLCTFVDTSCDYFQDRIAHMRQFSDGLRYTGYLWDCMLDREPVSCHYLISQLQALTGPFYVFWDIHSCDRIFIGNIRSTLFCALRLTKFRTRCKRCRRTAISLMIPCRGPWRPHTRS